VERDLITSLASLLDTLESTGDPGEAVSICSKLELQVQAASLPSVLNAGILAEILATRSHCFEQLNENTKAQSDLIRVAQLAPAHPMASREAVKGGAKSPKAGGNRDPVFDDIGGWETPNTFQHQLKLIFESYFGNPDLEAVRQGFASYGRSPSRSFLLFGPSGCGKTYMIRAFAGEYYARHGVPLPMYTMRLNEIMEKWVGESEKTLTRIFKTAIQTQPSILFADEIDALGSSRETSQSWAVTQTAHFLQEIDRLQTEEAFVLFVGCTNRIWAVDSALMRRFEQLIPVELPDVKVRKAIFSAQLRRLHESKRPATLNLQALAEASHGLTPGDISNVIKRASELAQRDGGRALSDLDILTTLRSFQNPMHVRNWVHQSIAALRQAGHEDRANQVEEIYGPYVGDLHSDSGSSSSPGVNWRPVPENAWREELPYDISLIRSNRQ